MPYLAFNFTAPSSVVYNVIVAVANYTYAGEVSVGVYQAPFNASTPCTNLIFTPTQAAMYQWPTINDFVYLNSGSYVVVISASLPHYAGSFGLEIVQSQVSGVVTASDPWWYYPYWEYSECESWEYEGYEVLQYSSLSLVLVRQTSIPINGQLAKEKP